MSDIRYRDLGLICLVVLALPSIGLSQEAPSLGYVFPPAIEAGKLAKVQLGGYDFTSDMQFFVHDEQVVLSPKSDPGEFFVPGPPYWFGPRQMMGAFPIPREISAEIQTPNEMLPGLVKWQVANANGISGAGVFYVSDIREVVEDRWRDDPQHLGQLPVGVSGRVRKISEVDRYRFKVSKLKLVDIDLMARRLGSNFNAVLELRDSSGAKIADIADTEGVDCKLTIVAQPNEEYTVSVYDVDFRGNRAFVYRLAIDSRPNCIGVTPAYGRRGSNGKVSIWIPQVIIDGRVVTSRIVRDVSFPADPSSDQFLHVFEFGGRKFPIQMGLSDDDELREPDRSKLPIEKRPFGILAPKAILGTIKPGSSEDRIFFDSKKDEQWSIQLRNRSFTDRLDLSLEVLDSEGKTVAQNDDLAGTLDAGVTFKAAADGRYTCLIRESSGSQGSESAFYRLSIQKPQPDFQLSTTKQALKIDVGGKLNLTVKVARTGNFNGEIKLAVNGLPPGASVPEDLKVPEKKTQVNIPITIAADAATTASMISVTGTAQVEDRELKRNVIAPLVGNLCPMRPEENKTSSILLAITMKPPIKVKIVDKDRQRVVSRGSTYPCPIKIERDETFKGPIKLRMAAKQSRHRQGMISPTIDVAADQTDALYPIFMPEWLGTERTSRMVVHGIAEVKDPSGKIRQLAMKADARITMIMEGALLKLRHKAHELTVKPGDSFDVPLTLLRTSEFLKPVTVELAVTDELTELMKADAIRVDEDTNAVAFKIDTMKTAKLVGDWKLTIKATAIKDGKWPVVSQTDVPVRFVQ